MRKKMNIVLDLDQTVISAEAYEDYNTKHNKRKAKKFSYEDMDGYYVVFERPGLQPFLDFLFSNFNVSVWTAASKDYALFIIEKILLKKPGRKIDWIFFSYHCEISKKIKKRTKHLHMFWEKYEMEGYNVNNTIILDDYDEVYNTQKNNCIFMKPFEFTEDDSENDNFLQLIKPHLENILSQGNTDSVEIVNNELEDYR